MSSNTWLTQLLAGKISLKEIPVESRDDDICLAAVTQNSSALEWVPEPQQTEAICLVAVEQDGTALKWVLSAN